MKEIIEKIVNAWWQTYENESCAISTVVTCGCKRANIDNVDFYPDSFEAQLEELLPEYHFQFDGSRWFIASEL